MIRKRNSDMKRKENLNRDTDTTLKLCNKSLQTDICSREKSLPATPKEAAYEIRLTDVPLAKSVKYRVIGYA